MNKWQVHVVIHSKPTITYEGTIKVLKFKAMHTDALRLSNGELLKQEPQRIHCEWTDPPDDIRDHFKEKALVYLEGKPYCRVYRRPDGTTGYMQAIRIRYGNKHQGSGANAATGASDPEAA